jgi:hypothetical protein
VPYFESDHVLNLTYNLLAGGTCLEDLELLRSNETYLNVLDAQRIPDPTTAGAFLRCFDAADLDTLMRVLNDQRVGSWEQQPDAFREQAIVEADGTLVGDDRGVQAGHGPVLQRRLGLPPLGGVPG